jgi:hypothetical protein
MLKSSDVAENSFTLYVICTLFFKCGYCYLGMQLYSLDINKYYLFEAKDVIANSLLLGCVDYHMGCSLEVVVTDMVNQHLELVRILSSGNSSAIRERRTSWSACRNNHDNV